MTEMTHEQIVTLILEDCTEIQLANFADDLLDDLWFLKNRGRKDIIRKLAHVAVDLWQWSEEEVDFATFSREFFGFTTH
jgi:hypothetical protein